MGFYVGNPAARVQPVPFFGAKRQFSQPATIEESRFRNDRVPLKTGNLVRSLLEKMDEAMTVAGEVYSGNEAFTTIIDLDVQADNRLRQRRQLNASLNTQVEHTMNVGKQGNVGIMVLSSQAAEFESGSPIARTRAIFNAIAMPQGQGMTPMPVQNLDIREGERPISEQAAAWNKGLSAFYKQLATRLGAKDPAATLADVARLPVSDYRLVNGNLYVATDMLNKKQTGHGGITAALAVQDMLALSGKLGAGSQAQVQRVTANYLAPFHITDALQLDTTVDHIEPNGDVFLSSRISKLDTKSRKAEGPIILVNAKVSAPSLADVARLARFSAHVQGDGDAQERQREALAWKALVEANPV